MTTGDSERLINALTRALHTAPGIGGPTEVRLHPDDYKELLAASTARGRMLAGPTDPPWCFDGVPVLIDPSAPRLQRK